MVEEPLYLLQTKEQLRDLQIISIKNSSSQVLTSSSVSLDTVNFRIQCFLYI